MYNKFKLIHFCIQKFLYASGCSFYTHHLGLIFQVSSSWTKQFSEVSNGLDEKERMDLSIVHG
jgi:hypothetical protein